MARAGIGTSARHPIISRAAAQKSLFEFPMPFPLAPGILARPDLWDVEKWVETIDWKPFHPRVEIHRIYGDSLSGPSAAMLRFQPGGKVPMHEHTGYEHIIVLSGSQTDQFGVATAGTLRVHAPGTRHSVESENGCVVLAFYEKPAAFLEQNGV